MAKPKKKSKLSKNAPLKLSKNAPLTIEIHGNGIAISAHIETGTSGKSAGVLIDEIARRLTSATPANADPAPAASESQPSIEIIADALRNFPDEFLDRVGDAVRDEMTRRALAKAEPAPSVSDEPKAADAS